VTAAAGCHQSASSNASTNCRRRLAACGATTGTRPGSGSLTAGIRLGGAADASEAAKSPSGACDYGTGAVDLRFERAARVQTGIEELERLGQLGEAECRISPRVVHLLLQLLHLRGQQEILPLLS